MPDDFHVLKIDINDNQAPNMIATRADILTTLATWLGRI
jgi:hypothetical protein